MRRTTASASWIRKRASSWTAATLAYGRNNKLGGDFNAFLAEATPSSAPTRSTRAIESLQVESDVLRFGEHTFVGSSKLVAHEHVPETGEGRDVVSAFTLGGLRTIARPGWDLGAGADVTFYVVPDTLRPNYGSSPVSFHVLLPRATALPDGADDRYDEGRTVVGHGAPAQLKLRAAGDALSISPSARATNRETPSAPR